MSTTEQEEQECEGCGKMVDKNTLRTDFLGEKSCQGCRDVQDHFGLNEKDKD